MKNLYLSDVVKAIILCLVLSTIFCMASYAETHYLRKGEVIAIEEDEVVVEDTTGNQWVFIGDDFAKGDKIVMTMMDRHTAGLLEDDEIVNVKVVK